MNDDKKQQTDEERKRVVAEPAPFDFEVKWKWVVGPELAKIMARKDAGTGSGPGSVASAPSDDDVDVASILSKDVEWVVEVDEDGQTTAIVGSPSTGTIDPEKLRQALQGLGATVRVMSAFEAVSRPWATTEAREPWATLVRAALSAMQKAVEAGEALTLRRVLDEGLPPAPRVSTFRPL